MIPRIKNKIIFKKYKVCWAVLVILTLERHRWGLFRKSQAKEILLSQNKTKNNKPTPPIELIILLNVHTCIQYSENIFIPFYLGFKF